MKIETKRKNNIKAAVLSGLGFGVIMEGFDYLDNVDFRYYRFILNVIIFGAGMLIMIRPKNNED